MKVVALALVTLLAGCESLRDTAAIGVRVDVNCEGPCDVIVDGTRREQSSETKVRMNK